MARNFFLSDFFSAGTGGLVLAAGDTPEAYRQGDRESSRSLACEEFCGGARATSPGEPRRSSSSDLGFPGGKGADENRRLHLVAGKRVSNLHLSHQGGALGQGGESMEALPTAEGVGLSQPDSGFPANH